MASEPTDPAEELDPSELWEQDCEIWLVMICGAGGPPTLAYAAYLSEEEAERACIPHPDSKTYHLPAYGKLEQLIKESWLQ